ncbi:DUF937 domain-containing protein [bacterium]|nr:DUF937 domain-containing protein [bacterium]
MGLLDELVGKAAGMLGGAQGGEGQGGLLDEVMGMLAGGQGGGLSGLVQNFKDKGLGDIVSSWISTGENLPISADQIKEGLGSETVQNLAAKVGISPDDLSAQLSQFLPGVIDKLTPDGTVPEGGLREKGLEFLKGKLG